MKMGDGRNKAKPESVAGREAASLKPVETLKNLLTFFARDSRPIIGNRDHGIASALFDLDRHSARLMAMLDGIVDEIGHCLEQEVPVSPDKHAPVSGNPEMSAFFFRRGIEQFDHLARDFCQVYLLERVSSILRLYLRDPHKS
jgi:hypothetical protein